MRFCSVLWVDFNWWIGLLLKDCYVLMAVASKLVICFGFVHVTYVIDWFRMSVIFLPLIA